MPGSFVLGPLDLNLKHKGVCTGFEMVMCHLNACSVSYPPFRSIADTFSR